MKTQTCKLARIATVVCTSVAPFAVAYAQHMEAVEETTAESAGTADAPLAPPPEESLSGFANLPIVDAAESDAQCMTDAASAQSVAVSYAAPTAVPVHTDTVATMSTPSAATFFAHGQANEPDWGKPRGNAMSLADADTDAATPARPAPLENAARVDEARNERVVVPVEVDATVPQVPTPPCDSALQRAAGQASLPDAPLPVRKPPVSYAAPVAVPARTAQADVEPVMPAAQVRHVSYAAPVAVPVHRERRTPLLPSCEVHQTIGPLVHARPFMSMHVNAADATAAVTPALPVQLILPPAVRRADARPPIATAIDLRNARASEASPEALPQAPASRAKPAPATPRQTEFPRAASPQLAASEAKPVSYAAPIAVPSRGASTASTSRPARPDAHS
ncbi:hypothetical protein [Paraburkholderia sp. SOS3]|uniref:hypothetical protein n=1 Tax=Paraburkholderia sp. SOS3 TaxID=1926494 RepID=UPI0012EC02A7|nr:hypothetical protein [Paraburkholderia sp. SOS3]